MNPRCLRHPGPLSVMMISAWLCSGQGLAYDWLQLNGNPQHSGNNSQETILRSSNVANLLPVFQALLPGVADGAPVSLSGVSTPLGLRDLLFVTTRAGHIVALDANTGAQIWSRQYPAGPCRINGGVNVCYTTSSPAIDPNRQYVYSYGLDGYVHKYRVGDGIEVMAGGWPELVTLKGFDEKGSSALSIATASSGASYLYVTTAGYPGDAGDYQGHVTAINLADGTQRVFNALCSDQAVHFVVRPGTPDCPFVQTGIWARVGTVYDNVTDRIYMATGNGLFDAISGGHEWGDSVFALSPDGVGSGGLPLDSYTPTNYQQLDNTDADLGSTAPAILPSTGFPGRLAVQSGKDANLRLINLSNLSGLGGPGHVGGELQILPVPQGGGVLTVPAVWINPADNSTWVFVTNGSGISALKLMFPGGSPSLVTQWQSGLGGFSPLIANNVLYYAASGVIRALNPVNGSLLWSDTTSVGGIHWESPVVSNGVLYITDEASHLTAYTVRPTVSLVSPSFGPTAGGTQATIVGMNFQPGVTVSFGGVAATGVTVVNTTTITATTGAHAAGVVDVVVTNPDTLTGTLAGGFTYSTGAALFTLAPCRVADTRNPPGPSGGPALGANTNRTFPVTGLCSIPPTAKAVAIVLAVITPNDSGDLRLYPAGGAAPLASSINFRPGIVRAGNAVVPLGTGGQISVQCDMPPGSTGSTDFLFDVYGYFQ